MYTLDNRPFKFVDVIGNEKTIKEFQTRYIDHSFPQVMFFLGNTGTGKTTIANIISALINCHNPTKDNEPCGECPSCIDIKTEKFARDVVRINGGNLGKDGINEIESKVSYSPMYDHNKIIILEEGHLISTAGKEQALLLLEKPRKNVYFIIISSEKEKFSQTILHRGQVYIFKSIKFDVIAKYLLLLLNKYDSDCKLPDVFIKEGLLTIAENSQGSVRKAIEDLERCIKGEIYTASQIEQELNYISEKKLYELLNMLLSKDKEFFNEINKIEIEEYFYYSWKILTNSRIIELTIKNINEASWQEKSSLQYCKTTTFKSLITVYEKIFADNRTYFNSNIFYNYIIDYYQTNEIPLIQKKENTNILNNGTISNRKVR